MVVREGGSREGTAARLARALRCLFDLDPLCLIHGVFFSSRQDWKDFGNPKVRRAVTAVVEAHGVRPLVSGRCEARRRQPHDGEKRGSSEGFGFVPFGRTEYTAEEIELTVVLDLEQIRGYGLSEEETDLLTAVALWEVVSLLDRPLRLRTACDLELDRGAHGGATGRLGASVHCRPRGGDRRQQGQLRRRRPGGRGVRGAVIGLRITLRPWALPRYALGLERQRRSGRVAAEPVAPAAGALRGGTDARWDGAAGWMTSTGRSSRLPPPSRRSSSSSAIAAHTRHYMPCPGEPVPPERQREKIGEGPRRFPRA